MSTVVIPRERHAGEKTARQVGQEREGETIAACLRLQPEHGSVGILHQGGARGEDGLGAVRGCRVRRESHRTAGSFSQGIEQDWPCRQSEEDRQAAATLL